MNSVNSKPHNAQQEQVRAITIDTGVSPDYDHSRHRRQSSEHDLPGHDQLGKSPDYKNSNRVFFTHHSTCSCRGSGVGCDCAMSCDC
ncbi:hypothetical protein NQZ79_g8369 [Umbelopsis isabellina]|nr:hypothetical protein NQZ79_g8369 [Umbelopsis isabellina]